MQVYVCREADGSPALDCGVVRVLAERMLLGLSLEDAELSILLTDDAAIHVLNREHRGKDRPTDVLAFPQDEEAFANASGSVRLLGDVVISLDTALRQGTAREADLVSEVTFLLAHGLLHLVGYDHQTDEEEREMTSRTRDLVELAAR